MSTSKARWALPAVLITALVAAVVWYIGSDRFSSGPVGNEFVGVLEQDQSEDSEEAPTVVDLIETADSQSSSIDQQEPPDASGVRRLFSEPDYLSDAYREASEEADEFLRTYPANVSRNMIVKADTQAIRELMQEIESNTDKFDRPFEVSAFSDVPCVISRIRTWTGRTPRDRTTTPDSYLVIATCNDNPSTSARISVAKDRNAFQVSVVSEQWGAFNVMSLGDWEYSIAYRNDDVYTGVLPR